MKTYFLCLLLLVAIAATPGFSAEDGVAAGADFAPVLAGVQDAISGLEQHLKSLTPEERDWLNNDLANDEHHRDLMETLASESFLQHEPLRYFETDMPFESEMASPLGEDLPEPQTIARDAEGELSDESFLGTEATAKVGGSKSVTGYDLTQTIEKYIAITKDTIIEKVRVPLDKVTAWKRQSQNSNVVKRKVTEWLEKLVAGPVNWTITKVEQMISFLRTKMGLPGKGWWLLIDDAQPTLFVLKPLKLVQTGRGVLNLDVDLTFKGGVHAGLYQVDSSGRSSIFDYKFNIEDPVQIQVGAVARALTKENDYSVSSQVRLPKGLRAIKMEMVKVMHDRMFKPVEEKIEEIYQYLQKATEKVVDWAYNSKLVSWAGGAIERTMKKIADGMRAVANFFKELVKIGEYLATRLLLWLWEKEQQARSYIMQELCAPRIAKVLKDNLVYGGKPLWSVLREPYAANDAIHATISQLSANRVMLEGGLAQSLVSMILDPLVASASEVEAKKAEFRAAEGKTGKIKSRDLCAAKRCAIDAKEGGQCHAEDLLSYKAFSKLVFRTAGDNKLGADGRVVCWEGEVLPALLKKNLKSYKPYCCRVDVGKTGEMEAHVFDGECTLQTCTQEELPKELEPIRDIKLTMSESLYDKMEGSPKMWATPEYSPSTAEGTKCSFSKPKWKDSTALWVVREGDLPITAIRLIRSRYGERCPPGYEAIEKTYLNEEPANLYKFEPTPERTTDTDVGDMSMCVLRGGRKFSPITEIKLVPVNKQPPTHFKRLLTTVTGQPAHFVPLQGCERVYLAVRRLDSHGMPKLADTEAGHRDLAHKHSQDEENRISGELLVSNSPGFASHVHGLFNDVYTLFFGETQTMPARECQMRAADYLGFGIAFSPPSPPEFPGMGFKIWLQDVQPLSYLYLKQLSVTYKDEIRYNELGATKENPRTSWGGCITNENRAGECKKTSKCAGIGKPVSGYCRGPRNVQCCVPDRLPSKPYAGPGFSIALDLKVAAQAKIVVLGTPLFGTELTLGELIAGFIPRDVSVTASKYPGGSPEDVLFSTDGPARFMFHLNADASVFFDTNLQEWRFRIVKLKIKELNLRIKPTQKPYRWVVDTVVGEGLDIARDLFDLSGMEAAFGKENKALNKLGVQLAKLKGSDAHTAAVMSLNIPSRLLGSDVLKPVYAVLREQLLQYGFQVSQ